jgi:hypothetical protein
MAEVTPEQPAAVTPEAPTAVNSDETTEAQAQRRIPLLGLVLLAAAVLLAFYVGTNILTVLFGVVSPPEPPVPANLEQVSHESKAYGVDVWKYSTPTDSCDIVRYFQENGGYCVYAPNQCGAYRESDPNFANGPIVVARCEGEIAFSIFNEQWSALITKTRDRAHLELSREVFWIGTGPQ